MRILIKLCKTILCTSIIYHPAIAAHCKFNGEWMLADVPGGGVLFEQQEMKVFMSKPSKHPQCGELRIEGISDGSHFSLKQYMTNTELEYCRSWTLYEGYFTNPDCSKVDGTLTMHLYGMEDDIKAPFTWFRNIIQIISPAPGNDLIISAEPKMPAFEAEAKLVRPENLPFYQEKGKFHTSQPAYTWHLGIMHNTVPNRVSHDTKLDDIHSDSKSYRPNFDNLKLANDQNKVVGGIMGGELTVSVEYYQAVKDEKKYIVKGTNPGVGEIDKILTTTMSRQIACQESKYKQFIALREGGIGFPVIGKTNNNKPIGGIGIMQIYNSETTPGQVWNWKENLLAGLDKITKSHKESEHAHINERLRLNKERLLAGLPICPEGIPAKLTPEQLQRDTIRRYNCGREFRWAPRDAPNCEGRWVIDLSCKRERKQGYDENYVNKVLNCNINK